MFADLSSSHERLPQLLFMGRNLSTRFMLSTESEDWLVTVSGGRIEDVSKGPFVMPSYDFRIVAGETDWQAFLQPVPAPGCNDLMALIRRGVMQFQGNLHPLMSHLLFFKLLLASLRPAGETP